MFSFKYLSFLLRACHKRSADNGIFSRQSTYFPTISFALYLIFILLLILYNIYLVLIHIIQKKLNKHLFMNERLKHSVPTLGDKSCCNLAFRRDFRSVTFGAFGYIVVTYFPAIYTYNCYDITFLALCPALPPQTECYAACVVSKIIVLYTGRYKDTYIVL